MSILHWILLLALDAPQPQLRQEIVVTAERAETPRAEVTTAVAVIDEQIIDQAPAANAAELLALASISTFSASSSVPATISVRGFYGGGEVDVTRLLVDGVPLADVESGVAPWQQLRASEIERIEVVRGLASTLYGDAAIGGVVQLFTRRREAGDWTATLTGGSFATRELDAAAWTGVASGELAIFGTWRETDGDRPHADAKWQGIRAKWHTAHRERLFAIAGAWESSSRNDPGPLPLHTFAGSDAMFARDGDDSDRRHLSLRVDATRWTASLHAASRDADGTRTILLLPPLFADTASRALTTREVGAATQLRGETWRAGLDAAAQRFAVDWSDDTPLASTHASRTSLAAYATKQLRLAQRVLANAGLRVDRIDSDTALSPRLGLAFDAGATTLYAGAGGGFKAPSLEQLYDVRPLRLFGDAFTLANRELEPQRARSIEAGIAHRARIARIALDLYDMRVTNEIDFDPRTFRYGNIARSTHRGLELMVEPNVAWLPRIAYALARVHGQSDAQLKNVPEHTLTAMLPLRFPRGFDAALLHTWTGGRFYDDDGRVRAPDTNALSLRLQKRLGIAALRLDVVNALDEDNTALGYTLADLSGGVSTYAYPDQRRTIRLSLAFAKEDR